MISYLTGENLLLFPFVTNCYDYELNLTQFNTYWLRGIVAITNCIAQNLQINQFEEREWTKYWKL